MNISEGSREHPKSCDIILSPQLIITLGLSVIFKTPVLRILLRILKESMIKERERLKIQFGIQSKDEIDVPSILNF